MLLDLDDYGATVSHDTVRPADPVEWSVLVPFFNERELLPGTLTSLAAQTMRVRLVLIDNGSTDGSADVADAVCRRLGLDYLLIEERRPGKVAALEAGLKWVRSRYVATCDADTWYPPDYLTEAHAVLATEGCVVAGAFFAGRESGDEARAAAGRKMVATARLLRGQCHTGGAGQAFRTAALRQAGGFDPARWSYVLEDHEIIHRVMKLGRMGYSASLWCAPSLRERDRDSIRWTLVERLLYAATAPVAGDWFFYRFLARRLNARRLTSERIRERQFQTADFTTPERTMIAAAYPVCG